MKPKSPTTTANISEEETALFRESVGKVTPIHCDQVIHPHKRKRVRSHHRQQLPHHQALAEKFGTPLHPLSKNQLRKFQQGRLAIDGRLDLHGKTSPQAEEAIKQFIEQACYLNCHCVLIIHGKGVNSQESIPVLKELTHYLLGQHPKVASYSIASKNHGGEGATYALINQH